MYKNLIGLTSCNIANPNSGTEFFFWNDVYLNFEAKFEDGQDWFGLKLSGQKGFLVILGGFSREILLMHVVVDFAYFKKSSSKSVFREKTYSKNSSGSLL